MHMWNVVPSVFCRKQVSEAVWVLFLELKVVLRLGFWYKEVFFKLYFQTPAFASCSRA